MNTLAIVLCIFGAIVVGTFILLFLGKSSFSKEKAVIKIQGIVDKTINKKNITNAVVLIESKIHGIDKEFIAGKIDGVDIKENQPFHTASVGKSFTATLIGCLIDDDKINLDDKIAVYIDDKVLNGLFEYNGADNSGDVTVRQLLNHTSGIADYFEDKTDGTQPMKNLVLSDKDKIWKPGDLVEFSKRYQKCIGKPGDKYHYSDTGYILLGIIIEKVSGTTFSNMLYEKIFKPLDMKDTYLMFYQEPVNDKREIADIWFNGVNIKEYNSLSIDWAGGGIVSTARDLATFIRSLNNYNVISKQTLMSLYKFDQKFIRGIHYGNGFMEYHFGEFMPTLKSFPHFVGHIGVLGTQMFYDSSSDTVYISNFGSSAYTSGSVRTMIKILSTFIVKKPNRE